MDNFIKLVAVTSVICSFDIMLIFCRQTTLFVLQKRILGQMALLLWLCVLFNLQSHCKSVSVGFCLFFVLFFVHWSDMADLMWLFTRFFFSFTGSCSYGMGDWYAENGSSRFVLRSHETFQWSKKVFHRSQETYRLCPTSCAVFVFSLQFHFVTLTFVIVALV